MKRIMAAALFLAIAVMAAAKDEEIVTKSDSPKMREAYENLVLDEKNPTLAAYNEAGFMMIKGQYEGAIEKYRQVLAVTPNEVFVLNSLSWALIMTGRYDEAIEYLKKSNVIDPKNPSTGFYLGVAYWEINDPQNAEKYLRMAVTLDPNYPYSHYYLSKVYRKIGNLKDALQEAELAAFILDSAKIWNPDVALLLGDLYGRMEMFQKSILQYQKLIDEDDYAFDANYGLGIAYARFGDNKKAEDHLTMALDLVNDDPMVYYALGKLYSQQDDKLKKGLTYAEKALDYEPDNSRFLYLVGWIHYRMDNSEQALEFMRKAVTADPANAEYRYQVKVIENEINGKNR